MEKSLNFTPLSKKETAEIKGGGSAPKTTDCAEQPSSAGGRN